MKSYVPISNGRFAITLHDHWLQVIRADKPDIRERLCSALRGSGNGDLLRRELVIARVDRVMPNTYAGAYLKPQGEVTFKSASRLDIVASGQSASAVEALRQRLIAIGDAAAKRISDIEGDALAAAQPAIDRVEAAAMDKLMRSLAQVAV